MTGNCQDTDKQIGDLVFVGSLEDGTGWNGLADLAGNVAEWVRDEYSASEYAESGDRADCLRLEGEDAMDIPRIRRGGSFASDSDTLRTYESLA